MDLACKSHRERTPTTIPMCKDTLATEWRYVLRDIGGCKTLPMTSTLSSSSQAQNWPVWAKEDPHKAVVDKRSLPERSHRESSSDLEEYLEPLRSLIDTMQCKMIHATNSIRNLCCISSMMCRKEDCNCEVDNLSHREATTGYFDTMREVALCC